MADELAAAKKIGMKEGMSKVANKVIDKYLDSNLEGMVLRQATKPKVCAAFNELTKAIMEDDMSAYRGIGLLYKPFNFMKHEFDNLREIVKKSGEEEANKILSDFVYQKTAEDIDNLISDPKRLKIIISKINEFQVNSTGKV